MILKNQQTLKCHHVGINQHRVLVVAESGTPIIWSSIPAALKYVVLNRISFSLGVNSFIVFGGAGRNGVKTSVEINSICAIKNTRFSTYGTNAKLSNKALFERDSFTCAYCGGNFPSKELTRDHIIPRAQGGKNLWENCVTACQTCNHKKGNRTPEQANMTLLFEPFVPSRMDMLVSNPKSWMLDDQIGYISRFATKTKKRKII